MILNRWCFSVNFLTTKIMNMNNSFTIETLNKRLCTVERTISSLQAEVVSIKKVLQNLNESDTNHSKKRKLCDQTLETDLSNINFKDNFLTDDEGFVQVFTDGACENNGQKNAKAGLGVWFGHNHPLNLAEPVKRRPTNNVGEIEACTRAIEQAYSKNVSKLCINTDSEFTINCITKWIHGWKKKGWKTASGKPVINKDELIELDNTMKLISHLKWNHVRGHKGIEGNEEADKLARQGAQLYKLK